MKRKKHVHKIAAVSFILLAAVGVRSAILKKKIPITPTNTVASTTVTSEGYGQVARPIAAMLDNDPLARPHSGIAEASLVFESPVEGGVTRLLAIWDGSTKLPSIGPTRSVRVYFSHWAAEVDAFLAHVGGSAAGLEELRDNRIAHVDGDAAPKYFWRTDKRKRPHNMYTSSDFIGDAAANYGLATSTSFRSWPYKNEAGTKQRGTISPQIAYGGPYSVRWSYDAQNNWYNRYVAGELGKDAEGKAVRAKNIVAIITDIKVIDEVGRLDIRTLGRGKGIFFVDGNALPITWEKAGKKDRLRFFDEKNQEVKLNRGTTWVEVVGSRETIKY